MRRLFAAILAAVLIWGGLPVFAEEVISGINLLPNPGFDTLYTDPESGRTLPEDWGWSFWAQSYTRVSKENPHSGAACVEIIKSDSGNPSICVDLENIRGGDTYTVGYFARSPETLGPSAGFGVEFDYYNENGEKMPLISGRTLRSVPTTDWLEYKQDFVIPDGVKSLRLWFVLPASGTVFLDDVFFCHTKEKSPYALETDAVFYYTDDPTPIEATVSDSGSKGDSVQFSLLRQGKTPVALPGDGKSTFSEGTASISFPVSTLSASMTEYVLKAEIFDKNGNVLETQSKKIYRYPRPSRLTKDGVYLKDGEPFVPVIGYHVDVPETGTLNQYDKCKEIGINVVTLSAWHADTDTKEGTRRIVDALKTVRNNGMMAIVALYRNVLPAGHSYNVENTMRVLAEIEKQNLQDAVFAFALMDEPMLHDRAKAEETMALGYRIVRESCPDIPVLCVDHRDHYTDYKRIADHCDILMSDAYPAGASLPLPLWEYVYTNLSFAKAATEKGNRVLYSLLQGCEWLGLFPTAEELRHTAMQSLLAGARAIGYYGVNDGGGTDKNGDPIPLWSYADRWTGLGDFSKEFIALFAHFNLEQSSHKAVLSGNGYRGEMWQSGEDLYAVLVNFSGADTAAADISLPVSDVLYAEYGKAYAWGTGDRVQYTLSSGEAVFLVFKKIGEMKFFVDNTETESPASGKTVRAETLLPAACDASFLAIYAERDKKKELVSFVPMTGEAEGGTIRAAATFTMPEGEGLMWKHVWWSGMSPQMEKICSAF